MSRLKRQAKLKFVTLTAPGPRHLKTATAHANAWPQRAGFRMHIHLHMNTAVATVTIEHKCIV